MPEIPAAEVVYPGDPVPAWEQTLDALDPEIRAAAIVAAAALVGRAGDLWTAYGSCSPSNTARPALQILTDVALTAALPLVTPET